MALENGGYIYKAALFPTVFGMGCAHRIGLIEDLVWFMEWAINVWAPYVDIQKCLALCPSFSLFFFLFNVKVVFIFQIHADRVNLLVWMPIYLVGLCFQMTRFFPEALWLPNEMQAS